MRATSFAREDRGKGGGSPKAAVPSPKEVKEQSRAIFDWRAQQFGTKSAPLFNVCTEKSGHHLESFIRLRRQNIAPERVGHRFEYNEVGIDSGAAKRAMEKRRLAQELVARARHDQASAEGRAGRHR